MQNDAVVVKAITRADLAEIVANLHAELRDCVDQPYSMEQVEKTVIDWLSTQIENLLSGQLESAAKRNVKLPAMKFPPYSDEDQRAQAWLEYIDKVYDDRH